MALEVTSQTFTAETQNVFFDIWRIEVQQQESIKY